MQAYSPRYDAALSLAALAHRGQTRKGSDVPYVVHPVHVSVMLIRHGFGEDVTIAGLLHDVVEDQDVPLNEIEAQFGPAVAEMVDALSERKQAGGARRPWEVRKQEALEQLRRASDDAVAVKAADTTHNSRALAADLREKGPVMWDFLTKGPDQTLWYYGRVAELVARRLGDHPLAREVDAAVADLADAIGQVRPTDESASASAADTIAQARPAGMKDA
jgi:(p)ppGpp synthase/HD superfamily hydrolase